MKKQVKKALIIAVIAAIMLLCSAVSAVASGEFYYDDVRFIGESGEVYTKVAGNIATRITVGNRSSSAETVYLIATVYNGTELESISASIESVPAGYRKWIETDKIALENTAYTYKAMIWNNDFEPAGEPVYLTEASNEKTISSAQITVDGETFAGRVNNESRTIDFYSDVTWDASSTNYALDSGYLNVTPQITASAGTVTFDELKEDGSLNLTTAQSVTVTAANGTTAKYTVKNTPMTNYGYEQFLSSWVYLDKSTGKPSQNVKDLSKTHELIAWDVTGTGTVTGSMPYESVSSTSKEMIFTKTSENTLEKNYVLRLLPLKVWTNHHSAFLTTAHSFDLRVDSVSSKTVGFAVATMMNEIGIAASDTEGYYDLYFVPHGETYADADCGNGTLIATLQQGEDYEIEIITLNHKNSENESVSRGNTAVYVNGVLEGYTSTFKSDADCCLYHKTGQPLSGSMAFLGRAIADPEFVVAVDDVKIGGATRAQVEKIEKEASYIPEQVTLLANGAEYEGVIDNAAKTITFDVDVYEHTTAAGGSYVDLKGAAIDTHGAALTLSASEFNPAYPMSLKSADESVEYKINVDKMILQKFIDFDEKTATTDTADDLGKKATTANGFDTLGTIVSRPLSGSDTAGEGKALCLNDTSQNNLYVYSNQSGDPAMAGTKVELSFDIRVDSITSENSEGDIQVLQGLDYVLNGGGPAVIFGTHTKFAKPDGADYSMALSNVGSIVKLQSPPAMKFKQWYNVKYVLDRNPFTGAFSYDIYLDGQFLETKTLTMNKSFGTPLGVMSGLYTAKHSNGTTKTGQAAYNVLIRAFQNSIFKAYFDNIKVRYSYEAQEKNLYLIGDSIMQTYTSVYTPELQGWGKYVAGYFDSSKINVINTAKSGHRAEFYLNGGTNASSGNAYYEPDFKHIKSQMKQGDYVLISIGLNDLTNYNNPEGLTDDIKQIISESQAQGATVILATETPKYTDTAFKERDALTEVINAAASEGVIVLDLGKAVAEGFTSEVTADATIDTIAAKYYRTGDATHFNEAGAAYIAEKFIGLLESSESTLKDYLIEE